jgi:metallophosphoesterase (TIGR03767 family)
MGQLEIRTGRARLVGAAVIVLALAIGGGSSQAGQSGLPDDVPLPEPADILGGERGDAPGPLTDVDCPRELERLGACKRDDRGHDPQDDFQPHDGDRPTDAERDTNRHGHPHANPRGAGPGDSHASGKTLGLTTIERTIEGRGDPDDGFQALRRGPGEPRIVREELAEAGTGRAKRRRSLLYFAQTTDWQLADEESPARVEFLDITANPPFPNALSAAWRPQEALGPYAVEQSIRQINELADASPVTHRGGRRAAMDMVVMTGDQADNQQLNETEWVMTLLEGGPLDPNSGTDPSACPQGQAPSGQTADPELYAGVQDYDDYVEGQQFYDPDEPSGPKYSDWPEYPGLMDRAQEPFTARGLDVPSYVVHGNHDGLAQGNQKAILPFEQVAVGCVKPLVPAADLTEVANILDPTYLAGLVTSNPGQVMLVPPDERRQYVDKPQYKDVFLGGEQEDGHGYGFVDEDELDASNGAASYYAWTPKPGIRMVGIDTLCEGGVVGPAANGNIDDPQFRWLTSQLERATERDQLVIVFGHHPIRSLSCDVPDETPPQCTVEGDFGHDVNPGCDLDPRDSQPLHDGADLTELFHSFPHVIAYVAGHTHENTLAEFDRPDGGAGDFWGIETASLVDWPPQNRLIELMDNCDGTLSIFGTTFDSAAPATAPASGTSAEGLNGPDLGSISRTIAYNDPQAGAGTGEGEPADRNVELLVEDPRREPPECRRGGGPGEPPGDPSDPPGGAGPSADDPDADGSLPFTGMVLIGLLVAGTALLGSGALARRAGRRAG